MSKKVDRRTFLKSSVAAGFGMIAGTTAGIGFVGPRSVNAGQPLRIMNGNTFSGPYAESGMLSSKGVSLAVEHFGGSVLG